MVHWIVLKYRIPWFAPWSCLFPSSLAHSKGSAAIIGGGSIMLDGALDLDASLHRFVYSLVCWLALSWWLSRFGWLTPCFWASREKWFTRNAWKITIHGSLSRIVGIQCSWLTPKTMALSYLVVRSRNMALSVFLTHSKHLQIPLCDSLSWFWFSRLWWLDLSSWFSRS